MNFGKIKQIVAVPTFIDKYIESKKDNQINSIILNDFCNIIKKLEYKINDSEYIFNVGDNYTVKRFVNFYIDKSELSREYKCKYEDELDIPKSISNELFTIEFEDKCIVLYIKKYSNDLLIFEQI